MFSQLIKVVAYVCQLRISGFQLVNMLAKRIAIALALRQVLLALTLGVFAGAWILGGGPLVAFRIAFEDIVAATLTDPFRAAILLFTAALGGMVAVMARAGGTRGLVDMVQHWIRDARSAQFATAVLGLLIFFDDYSNTLLVGNTMRPVTDRMRVSREKLSYIVDSTAAPVAKEETRQTGAASLDIAPLCGNANCRLIEFDIEWG